MFWFRRKPPASRGLSDFEKISIRIQQESLAMAQTLADKLDHVASQLATVVTMIDDKNASSTGAMTKADALVTQVDALVASLAPETGADTVPASTGSDSVVGADTLAGAGA